MKFNKKFIVLSVLGLSIVLLIMSLFFPAFYTDIRTIAGRENYGDSYSGVTAFFFGWYALLNLSSWGFGYIGWLANLFLPFAWLGLGLSLSKFRWAFIVGIFLPLIAIPLSLCSLFIKQIDVGDGGLTQYANITSMGIGFYLWLASFVVCAGGYFVALAIDLINKQSNSITEVAHPV